MDNFNKENLQRCVLVSGNGRSGSNRILDMLDASSETVCRNEPHAIEGGQFFEFDGRLFEEDLSFEKIQRMRQTFENALYRRSQRDRLNFKHKNFINRLGRASSVPMSKARFRNSLHALGVLQSPNEWTLLDRSLKKDLLARAVLVLKLPNAPAWCCAMAKENPNCLIVHNVRSPVEFLQSWYNRFIKTGVGFSSFEENFEDIPRILSFFGRADSERLRETTEENVIEANLWRWRYVNEKLLEVSDLPRQYKRVTYRDVGRDPLGTAESLYNFCGLPFDTETRARINSMKNTLFSNPHKFALDQSICNKLADRVLEDSILDEIVER